MRSDPDLRVRTSVAVRRALTMSSGHSRTMGSIISDIQGNGHESFLRPPLLGRQYIRDFHFELPGAVQYTSNRRFRSGKATVFSRP
jgi:hypothetical protein